MVIFLFVSDVYGDIFETNKTAEHHTALVNAINDEGKMLNLSSMGPGDVTSKFDNAFSYSGAQIDPLLTKRIDFNKSIKKYILDPSFSNSEIDEMVRKLSDSHLMMLQYTSPAVVDLFKHYHTIAHLKMMYVQGQLSRLGDFSENPSVALQQQNDLTCLQDETRGLGTPDFIQAMDSCARNQGLFYKLNNQQNEKNIMRFLLNKLGYRGEERDNIVALLPEWNLSLNALEVKGPAKRAGKLYEEFYKRFVDVLNEIDRQGPGEINQSVLDDLNANGGLMTQGMLRDWLLLPDDRRELLKHQWAGRWAYEQTLREYENVCEALQRLRLNANIGLGYQRIAAYEQVFIEHEIDSLRRAENLIREENDFNQSMGQITHEVKKDVMHQQMDSDIDEP